MPLLALTTPPSLKPPHHPGALPQAGCLHELLGWWGRDPAACLVCCGLSPGQADVLQLQLRQQHGLPLRVLACPAWPVMPPSGLAHLLDTVRPRHLLLAAEDAALLRQLPPQSRYRAVLHHQGAACCTSPLLSRPPQHHTAPWLAPLGAVAWQDEGQ